MQEEDNLPHSRISDDIGQVIQYLHTNYQDKITINELTRLYHTNRTTLNLKFKEVTKSSIIEYLNNLRIQLACSILRNTTLPVREITTRVGFKDESHFGRIFKKHINCSPSKYRQQNCWMV